MINPDIIAAQIDQLIGATSDISQEEARKAFKDGLAVIIATAIQSATVQVLAPPGTIVVVGSPSTQSNVLPISLTGTLS